MKLVKKCLSILLIIVGNPLGSSWLYEALRKGTFRDRAKAAAFLVSSNAEGNLDTLTTLIEFTRIPKKCNKDIIMTITDLWVSVLLPSTRKLYPLGLRGTHWRKLMECSDIDDLQKRRICAYWYFENSLKEKYYGKFILAAIKLGELSNTSRKNIQFLFPFPLFRISSKFK